jgi:hypothetical protein
MPFLINIIVGLVLSLASTLLQQAFAPKDQRGTGTRGSAQIGGKVPQYFLVGTVGEAGKLEYQNAWGSAGQVPNAFLTGVYSFGDLPITAMTKLFVNGTAEPIATTGHVAQGFPATGDKAGHLWAEFLNGTQTTASSYLVGKFSSDADRPWSSDMIGRGVPYLITTVLWSETLWTGFPSFVGEFQGIKLYDPRKDSTAGGSGSQRWDNPATWAFSDNNMVIIYNIERGIHYGGARVWGGSATASQLPHDVWAAAMDACDENVALVGGGAERRFRAGRRISLNERPADVIKEFLIGCNGRISHATDGTIYVLVGVPDEADGAFSDLDVLASEPLGSIPFPNLDSIINGATATYREPSQAWEDKETAPYYRSDLEAEDDGRQQIEGLDLATTFSGTQAQRVIRAVIEEGRRFKTHVVALPPEFARFRHLQVLAWTSDRFDYSAKFFLITARTRGPWGQVVFGLQEIDPTDHDWSPEDDEQPLSFAPIVINRPAPQISTGILVAPYIVVDEEDNARRSAIEVFWDGGLVDVRHVRVQVRESWGGKAVVADATFDYDVAVVSPSAVISNPAILPNKPYEVRVLYVPFSGRVTRWSNQDVDGTDGAWIEVTTPDVPEIQPRSVGVDELNQELRNTQGLVNDVTPGSLADRIAELEVLSEQLAHALAQGDLSNRGEIKVLKAHRSGNTAAVLEERRARVEADAATALLIQQVVAQLNNQYASAFIKFEVLASDEETFATIAMMVRVGSAGTLVESGIRLMVEIVAGVPRAQIALLTQNLVITDGTNSTNAITIDPTTGKLRLKELLFERIRSVDGVSIDINGLDPEVSLIGA